MSVKITFDDLDGDNQFLELESITYPYKSICFIVDNGGEGKECTRIAVNISKEDTLTLIAFLNQQFNQ